MDLLTNTQGIRKLIYNKKWRIHYIYDKDPWKFIISDTPILEIFPPRDGFYVAAFLQRTHYFVLTPKILIEFIDPLIPGKRLKRKQLKSQEEVDKFNILRLNWSHQYAYSSDKRDFSFILH